MDKAAGQGTRWWEFYVVRYTMGSVIGACIIYLLADANSLPEPLKQLIILGSDNLKNPSGSNYIWLLLLGITYCYITSGPILVFHLGRFLLPPTSTQTNVFTFIVILTPILGILAVNRAAFAWLIFASFASICIAQYVVAIACLRKHKELQNFYKNLAARRALPDGSNSQIVESYRHLKEHGNSFFIVLCELIFAGGIYYTPTILTQINTITGHANYWFWTSDYWPLGLYTFVWIIPAVVVWLVATRIEYIYSQQ